ncbi:MAG: hypothetical protein ACREJC_04475 [Tepidisphaeraceae bacterium]
MMNLHGLSGLHGLGLRGLQAADDVMTAQIPEQPAPSTGITMNSVWGLLALTSASASMYHGIKRNHGSIGWGLWWFLMGGLFPIATPIVAVARKPGFAKPK